LLVAIDTATRFMSLAVHDGRQIHCEVTWRTANNHTVELAPTLQRTLTQLDLTPADLKAVAVAQGPGSFTGLRIGMSVAKGLALAHGLAMVAIPTLEIVAAAVPRFDGLLLATLPAGRDRICAQSFDWQNTHWHPRAEAAITNWQHALETLDRPTLIAGEIDAMGFASIDAAEREVQISRPAVNLRRAGFLAELAWDRIRANITDDPVSVTPIYLHQPGVPRP
jgi:tRNA threonylcarbamoyladenosine biosynthesis protein TsaB